MPLLLCEDYIPGSSHLKTDELQFCHECRNNPAKGRQTKAEIVEKLSYSSDRMGPLDIYAVYARLKLVNYCLSYL